MEKLWKHAGGRLFLGTAEDLAESEGWVSERGDWTEVRFAERYRVAHSFANPRRNTVRAFADRGAALDELWRYQPESSSNVQSTFEDLQSEDYWLLPLDADEAPEAPDSVEPLEIAALWTMARLAAETAEIDPHPWHDEAWWLQYWDMPVLLKRVCSGWSRVLTELARHCIETAGSPEFEEVNKRLKDHYAVAKDLTKSASVAALLKRSEAAAKADGFGPLNWLHYNRRGWLQ